VHPFEISTSTSVFDQPVDFEFMAAFEWLDFHCELYDVVAQLDLDVSRIDPGVVRLRNGHSLGLLQLAQHCHLANRDDWHDLITTHLRTMTAHLGDIFEPFSMFDLRIRLVPDTPADVDTFRRFGARPFAEGIVSLLAVDVVDAVRCVPEGEINELGWDLDEAWASATVQTQLLEQADELHTIDLDGAQFFHVFGERPFTASMIGVLDDLIAPCSDIGSYGAIVALPLRHSILVHPIFDDSVGAAITGLVPIARQLYKQGPGSVSPHLYWWRHGQLTWIPTVFEHDGTTVEYYAPPELADIIATLAH
jgi:hypothetical protein